MAPMLTAEYPIGAEFVRSVPYNSDINLFCYRERVINLDPQVSDGALNFRMTQQELDSAQVAGAPIYQGWCRRSKQAPYLLQ